ncbi:MAG: hypothetical protein E6Q73_13115 [Pseudorhodobacter sp.]|nr:MAG: hypothetical protein E6Q73_13115 [Pseudorhodobacter sp.]
MRCPRRAFAVGLALLLSPVASHADDICDPAKGTALRVVGVAANDTLNVRTGPTSSNALVARLAPGQVVTSTGRAAQAKGQCYTTCSGAEGGLNDTGRSIAYGCKAKGQIWYELRSAKGEVGWASGRYLEVGGNAVKPPVIEVLPPRPPTFEKRFSYLCGASRLDVSIYPGGGDGRCDDPGCLASGDSRAPCALPMVLRGRRRGAAARKLRACRMALARRDKGDLSAPLICASKGWPMTRGRDGCWRTLRVCNEDHTVSGSAQGGRANLPSG